MSSMASIAETVGAKVSEIDRMQDLVFSFVVSPTFEEDRTCFQARGSGLFRSDDGGTTWQPAYDQLDLHGPLPTTTVLFSPEFGTDRTVFAGVYGAVAKSIDAGDSWKIVPLSSPPSLVSALAISPNYLEDGVLFAGTLEDGIFRSTDRGSTWKACNFGLIDLQVLSIVLSPDFKNDEIALAGTETGLFRSTNGGRSWREVEAPDNFASILCMATSPNYVDRADVFAGTTTAGLWQSTDAGRSWKDLAYESSRGEAINSILLAPSYPQPPDVLLVTDTDILVSRDGGRSWVRPIASLNDVQGVVSVVAPRGLGIGVSLLVATRTGRVVTATLEA
jgi:photosystem II stability/assembly factor-like uncharacterized protein